MLRDRIQPLFVLIVTLFLFFVPFVWFKDGQVDLGGDSSRLYFYQPLEYLKNQSLYSVSKSGYGGENLSFYGLPHFLFIGAVKTVMGNPTATIAAFYGLTLSFAFLFVYLSVRAILATTVFDNHRIPFAAAIVAALFYVFPPQLNSGWQHVILTFYQIFLNPMMFYLLLQFFVSGNFRYITIVLLMTVLFSPNFSYVGAPTFFAFYPMSILFLLLYTKFVRRSPIPLKGLITGAILFVLLHVFHIAPIVKSLFYTQSANAVDLFSEESRLDRGLGYFTGIAGNIRVSLHLLGLPQLSEIPWYAWTTILFPFTLILGSIKNRSKTFLLASIFFLLGLFWVSAKITSVGFEFYKALFYIPGFSMFRNFYGQWEPLFHFFYALVFGQALAHSLMMVRKKWRIALISLYAILLLVPALPFLRGQIINNGYHWQSNKVKSVFTLDPEYDEVLTFIRTLPFDGKFILFPFTDPGYQVVAGTDGGAYEGPSTIAYLTHKQDFSGYQELGVYKDLIVGAVRRGDVEEFRRLLATMGIRYIFYNSDPKIYDLSFPYQPYSHMRNFFPVDQESYKKFIIKLDPVLLYSKADKYFVYELQHPQYLPEVYVADSTNYFDKVLDDHVVRSVLPLVPHIRQAVFEYKYKPPRSDNVYAVSQPDSVFLDILKNPERPRLLHHSFVTTRLDAYTYPLIILREEFSLTRLKARPVDEQIDRRLFLSAKRILEMEKWGNDMSVGFTLKTMDDVIKNASRYRAQPPQLTHMNNWEASFGRYVRYFQEGVERINADTSRPSWQITQRFLMSEYLLQHRSRLQKLILHLSKSTEERLYLEDMLDLTFGYLYSLINYAPLDPTHIDYKLDRQEKSELYTKLLVEDKLKGVSNVTITQGSALYKALPQISTNGWLDFGMLIMDPDSETRFTLNFPEMENLMNSAQMTSITAIERSTDSATLTIDTSLIGGEGGLIWKVDQWGPESIYLLSFEYRTKNAPFDVRLVDEEVKLNKAVNPRVLLENQIYAKDWQHYQAVVKSSPFSNTAFLQFTGSVVNTPIANIEIRDPRLYRLPHPTILMQGVSKSQRALKAPIINVKKTNPTSYQIHVDNPERMPFTLVLNQQFSSQWKLKTGGKTRIKEQFHYQTNRFMNAWYIDPAIYSDEQSADFMLETEPQQIFYAGLYVSAFALLTVLYLCICPIRS